MSNPVNEEVRFLLRAVASAPDLNTRIMYWNAIVHVVLKNPFLLSAPSFRDALNSKLDRNILQTDPAAWFLLKRLLNDVGVFEFNHQQRRRDYPAIRPNL
jgi:hypothetical protein